MQTCASCDGPLTRGGIWDGPLRFCGHACLRAGVAGRFAVSRAHLEEAVWKIHQGQCPRCGERGPVDLHTSFHVWSAVIVTHWMADARLSCERCARSARRKAAGRSLLLGWWGVPFGLVMTPVQVVRNVAGNLRSVDSGMPSRALVEFVHARLAEELVALHVPEFHAERSNEAAPQTLAAPPR